MKEEIVLVFVLRQTFLFLLIPPKLHVYLVPFKILVRKEKALTAIILTKKEKMQNKYQR